MFSLICKEVDKPEVDTPSVWPTKILFAAFGKEIKGGKSNVVHCISVSKWILHPLLSHFKILNSHTASDAAGLEQTQEMKNLIDDLIHCCPP